MSKVRIDITIDEEYVKKAKDLGLNISKISENALKEYIRRIESPGDINDDDDDVFNDLSSLDEKGLVLTPQMQLFFFPVDQFS